MSNNAVFRSLPVWQDVLMNPDNLPIRCGNTGSSGPTQCWQIWLPQMRKCWEDNVELICLWDVLVIYMEYEYLNICKLNSEILFAPYSWDLITPVLIIYQSHSYYSTTYIHTHTSNCLEGLGMDTKTLGRKASLRTKTYTWDLPHIKPLYCDLS